MFEPSAPESSIPTVDQPVTAAEWTARFRRRLLNDRRASSSTLEAYTLDIAMLSRWATGRQQDLLCLTTTDLARYVSQRLEQGTHRSTLSRNISSCRRFYAFLIEEGAMATNPAASVVVAQTARQQPPLIPNDTLRILLRPPAREFSTCISAYRRRRDHAIVCTLYCSLLGISDVRLLRWEQIDELAGIIRVPVRGGRVRSYEFDARLLTVLEALRTCMATTDLDRAGGAYCFPTASGLPMSRQALCCVVQRFARDCGHAGVLTPSSLRQTGRAHGTERRRLESALAAAYAP
jgi:integrase/recombinase XerD